MLCMVYLLFKVNPLSPLPLGQGLNTICCVGSQILLCRRILLFQFLSFFFSLRSLCPRLRSLPLFLRFSSFLTPFSPPLCVPACLPSPLCPCPAWDPPSCEEKLEVISQIFRLFASISYFLLPSWLYSPILRVRFFSPHSSQLSPCFRFK